MKMKHGSLSTSNNSPLTLNQLVLSFIASEQTPTY